jgi:tape measure domain-containing protein
VADFKIGLDFSDGRLIEVLEKAFGAADRLDKKVDELQGQLNKGFPTANASKLSAEVDKTAKAATQGAASMRQFGQSAGLAFGAFQLGIGIVQGVGQGIANFATNTISLAGAAESAEANFTTFLGSASAAKDVLGDLNKFAADTPFTQTQINGVAQSLIAFGVEAEALKPTLQTLGDLSGGNAEKFGDLARIFGQAKTTTKLYTEDLNQLAERGIPVLQELAAQNGITEEAVRKLASEGKIGFADLEKAFASLTGEGGKFFGLMARQSQTFEGLRSTLEGNFEQLQASVGQLLLPTLKQLVISTNEVISAVDTSNFKDIGQDLAVSFQQFGDTFDPVIEAIKSGFGGDILPALTRFRDAVEDVIVDVSGFFSTLNEGGAPAAFITAVIETLSNAFAALVDSVSFAVEAIGDIAGPIINALAPAFRAVVSAGTAVLDTINSLSGAAPKAGGAFEGLGNILGGVASAIGYVVQLFAEAIKGVVGASDAMKSADPIIRGFGEVVDFLAAPWRALAGLIADGAAALADFLGLTEGEGEKQARIAQENAARIQQASVDQRDAYEAERDQRNENTAGEKKAVAEKRKVQAAAAAQSKAEREKAAKDAQKLEEDRAALQLALITDETKRQILAENARFEEQKKQTQTLFKGREELNGLLEKAEMIHKKNLADIAQGSADEQAKILEDQAKLRLSLIGDETGKAVAVEEARYQEQRAALIESFAGTEELNGLIEQAEAQHQANIDKIQFDAAAKRIADGAGTQKELAEAQVKLLEETQNRYLLELERGGASEEEIAKAKETFQLASQKLRLQNEIAYQQAILAAVATGDDAQRAEIEAQIAVLQAQLGNVDFQINAPDNLGEGLLGKIKNLKKNIAEALNIPPGEFDKLVGGAVEAVGNAFNAISAITDAQIATNQAVIDSLNERITAQQEAVDKEKEAADEGYANNLSGEQALLDGLIAQREAAEAKAKQLRDKALRLQLLQDTAQQVSNTAVAVTNIVKNTSAIPVVGILLAAIQIGSLFALLSASRQKAKAEAASTKFFKGGKIPMFRSDENGMRGNRIEGTNMEVGGNEFVVNRKVTNEHEGFLQRLNAGEYAGRDLEGTVGESSTEKAPTRANKSVRSESHESRFERWADAQFREIVRDRVLQSETATIAKEAVTNQVAERVYKSTMSDSQRHFFEQAGLALPPVNQVYKNVQMAEGAQMYPVHVPGSSVVSRHERIYAAPPVTDLAEHFTDRTREATEAVSGMVTASRDDQSGKIVAAVTQQTNDLIRRGLLPLMQLGHRIVDAEGNTVHYSTDASGNTRVSKLVS